MRITVHVSRRFAIILLLLSVFVTTGCGSLRWPTSSPTQNDGSLFLSANLSEIRQQDIAGATLELTLRKNNQVVNRVIPIADTVATTTVEGLLAGHGKPNCMLKTPKAISNITPPPP